MNDYKNRAFIPKEKQHRNMTQGSNHRLSKEGILFSHNIGHQTNYEAAYSK